MEESILVVEDEPFVRELISSTLQGAGYRVTAVEDGETALRQVSEQRPDLIVLDIRLPGMDGWEVLRRVRANMDVPVLFLTALAGEEHALRGLRQGADDYILKPFSPAMLAARAQVALRRSARGPERQVVRLRGLTIDLDSADVRLEGTSVHLTPTEFRMLSMLARRVGQVIGSRELLRSVQGYDLPDREAQEIVKVHVRHLRRKIEPDSEHPKYLVTVRGLGYMLNHAELESELG